MKLVERILNKWDSEDNEYIVRWRIFLMEWFPYRTMEFLGWDEEKEDFIWGDTHWHKPYKLERWRNG